MAKSIIELSYLVINFYLSFTVKLGSHNENNSDILSLNQHYFKLLK